MKKTVLITGATGGIGSALCREFAFHGHDIVMVATNKEKLEKLAKSLEDDYKIKTYFIAKDLSKKESTKEIFDELKNKKIDVEILCNNAGFGDFGEFLDVDLEKNLQMINVNICSLVSLCYIFGNEMKKRGGGKILNTASIGSFFPGPFMSTYYASKAFVLSFSEALAKELKPNGVSVCALCPGTTNTKFFDRAGANTENSDILKKFKPANPEDVAKFAYKCLMKNKTVAVHGASNRAFVFFQRFLPRKTIANIVYKVQKQRKK